jgi:hypothetical protein
MKLTFLAALAAQAAGVLLVISAVSVPAQAVIGSGPEIDAGLLPSALTLLVGGVLVLKARRWRS